MAMNRIQFQQKTVLACIPCTDWRRQAKHDCPGSVAMAAGLSLSDALKDKILFLNADPEGRHKVKGRTSFSFSGVRRFIAEAALNVDFDRVCPKPGKPTKNSLVAVMLLMVA